MGKAQVSVFLCMNLRKNKFDLCQQLGQTHCRPIRLHWLLCATSELHMQLLFLLVVLYFWLKMKKNRGIPIWKFVMRKVSLSLPSLLYSLFWFFGFYQQTFISNMCVSVAAGRHFFLVLFVLLIFFCTSCFSLSFKLAHTQAQHHFRIFHQIKFGYKQFAVGFPGFSRLALLVASQPNWHNKQWQWSRNRMTDFPIWFQFIRTCFMFVCVSPFVLHGKWVSDTSGCTSPGIWICLGSGCHTWHNNVFFWGGILWRQLVIFPMPPGDWIIL